jgi:hypothetical protein
MPFMTTLSKSAGWMSGLINFFWLSKFFVTLGMTSKGTSGGKRHWTSSRGSSNRIHHGEPDLRGFVRCSVG